MKAVSTSASPMDSAILNAGHRCPRCGSDNQCGIAGDTACWCAVEVEPALALPQPGQACYCRRCLIELVKERRRATST